jgi:hypothetical protein
LLRLRALAGKANESIDQKINYTVRIQNLDGLCVADRF